MVIIDPIPRPTIVKIPPLDFFLPDFPDFVLDARSPVESLPSVLTNFGFVGVRLSGLGLTCGASAELSVWDRLEGFSLLAGSGNLKPTGWFTGVANALLLLTMLGPSHSGF